MNHRPECLPCCLRRVLYTADRSTSDDWLRRRILGESMQELSRVDLKATPAEVVHGVIRRGVKTLGITDPYAEEKRRWIEEGLAQEERIRARIAASPDPLVAAIKLSIASNVLDWELRQEFGRGVKLKNLIEEVDSIALSEENIEDFRAAILQSQKVLFVHDSAGELLFDRLLIELLGKPREQVISLVRSAPALAHATRDDAAAAGLEKVAVVIDPGIDCLGLPLNAVSASLRQYYSEADLVIAKGQAAFETLEGRESREKLGGGSSGKSVFFLLRAKCALLAHHLGIAVGDGALERG